MKTRPGAEPEDFPVDGDLLETIDNDLLECLGITSEFDLIRYIDSAVCDDALDIPADGEESPAGRTRRTRRRRGEAAPGRGPRPKRNRRAPSSPETPRDVIPPSVGGLFQIIVPAGESPVVQALSFSAGPLTPPDVQANNHLSHPVMNSILHVGATYLLVSTPPLTPVPQITPQSPVNAAVAPLELSLSSYPVSSSSESASRGRSPSPPTSVTLVLPSNDKTTSKESPPAVHRAETSPAIPGHVQDYIRGLKSHLREACGGMDGGGGGMATRYVDTRLVRRTLVIRTGKNANKCLEKELVVLSNSERTLAAVRRGDVFRDAGGNGKHLITVLGKAGMGKSVLIQRLVLDWSSDQLRQFQFVFVLNCKVLDLTRPSHSLRSLLFESSSCPPGMNAGPGVFQHVRDSPDKALIVFDSFDDVKDLEGLLQSPATSETSGNHTVRQLFSGLFQKKILPGCTLLIASRPKDVLNQLLRKVDLILEVPGFSERDVEEYAGKYFGDPSRRDDALRKIRNQKYLFSSCSNPSLCRLTCFLVERQGGNPDALPSSLTDLLQRAISRNLELNKDLQASGPDVARLCDAAWEGIKADSTWCKEGRNVSKDVLEFGLDSGILTAHAWQNRRVGDAHYASLFVQTLLGALSLVRSDELNDRSLISQTVVHQRRRKCCNEWQDVLQRVVIGLLFQKSDPTSDGRTFQAASDLQAKRMAVEVQLENLKPAALTSSRLLEVFHCVYEARNVRLAKLLVKNLPEGLAFCGAQLSPVDAYVVRNVLKCAKGLKRDFRVDLKDTCVPLTGLKDLVALDCVKSFRAPTIDTIDLWEDLQAGNDELILRSAIEKFTIDPVKVSQVRHVDDLVVLVRIHEEKKLPSCEADPALERGVPAVRNLHKLEYELGQQNRPQTFLRLVEILPALESLQYLDIEKNEIGDAEAKQLAGVMRSLSALKMLNLSQNCIGDAGVENLAHAMASTTSLQNLSLYGNVIADKGAESLASALPLMKSLLDLDVKYNKFTDAGAEKLSAALKSCPWMKSVHMWNRCIPYGVFERFQLQDSRIKAL